MHCKENFWKIGRYLPVLEWDENKINMLKERSILRIPECRKCKLALLCGGGCASYAYDYFGSIYKGGCEEDMEKLFIKKLPIIYRKLIKEKNGNKQYINHYFLE